MNKRSFLLNSNWDIDIDTAGNLAMTDGLYCDAQNVANAIRMFTNDAYLAQDKGVPHFLIDLGVKPVISVVRSRYRKRALEVENIADATVTIDDMSDDRILTGNIEITTESGDTTTIEL